MFEEVLSEKAVAALHILAPKLNNFYLAGGTGLALHLGHRRSEDLDFFSDKNFNPEALLATIPCEKKIFIEAGTVHCLVNGIRVSLLYYEPALVYPPVQWHGILIADIRDIAAEKIKTISQRGAKKDFIDLYAILKIKYSISQVCSFFQQRFSRSDINLYHILKSLVFFEDAEQDPTPPMLLQGEDWEWETIKNFFVQKIELFERAFGQDF